MSLALFVLVFFSAVWLGFGRPLLGIAVGAGVAAVTSSLPWQVGLENLTYPLAYLIGYPLGLWLGGDPEWRSQRADADPGEPMVSSGCSGRAIRRLRSLAGLALIPPVTATMLAWARRYPHLVALEELGASATTFPTFNPAGLAGELQALLILVAGLLLFSMIVPALRYRPARDLVERGLVLGAIVALAAPLVQAALLDLTVRPDKNLLRSEGWVGFFQDPHSYAAYLVLSLGVLLGLSRAHSASRTGRWLYGTLAGLTWVVLLFTNSRSGLAASMVCILGFATLWAWLGPRLAWRRLATVAALLVLGVAATLAWPATRAEVTGALSRLGDVRMWEAFSPEGPDDPLLARRVLLWDKGLEMVATRPMWGYGADGFSHAPVGLSEATMEDYERSFGPEERQRAEAEVPTENAHSYFLQYASEYGLPGLVTLVALIGAALATQLRGVRSLPSTGRARVAGALAGVFGVLAISLFSHPLLLPELQIAFWIVVAYGVGAATTRPR